MLQSRRWLAGWQLDEEIFEDGVVFRLHRFGVFFIAAFDWSYFCGSDDTNLYAPVAKW